MLLKSVKSRADRVHPGQPGPELVLRSSAARQGAPRTARAALAVVLVGGAFALLQGCSIEPVRKEVSSELGNTKAQVEQARAQLEEAKKVGSVLRMRGSKITGEEVGVSVEKPLPDIFKRKFTYVTNSRTLAAVAEDVSTKSGLPIRLVNVAQIDGTAGDVERGMAAIGRNAVEIDYSGPLSGLLDLIAQKSKSYWRYVDGGVEFYEVETRSFQIFLSPGKRQVTSSIALAGAGGSGAAAGGSGSSAGSGAGGSGAGGGGSGAQSGTVSVDSTQVVDAYAGLVATVEALIEERSERPAGGRNGAGQGAAAAGGSKVSGSEVSTNVLGKSRVVANPSLGMLTVTANPSAMSRVAAYIKSINERFAANVRIDVRIYSLSLKRDTNVGFSADLIYQKLQGYGLAIGAQGLLQSTAGSSPSSMIFSVTDPTSRFKGSNLFVQALAEYGDVGVVTSGQVIAPNGQPSPLQIADELTYLASSSTVQTANVGTTTTLTPASRTVGFTANFLPLVLGDDRILLQYQINLSQLIGMNQVNSGNASIQTPNIRQQSLQQQAYVRDGQTIVLFGFESSRAESTNNQGLTGASANASKERQMTIITMQVFGGRNG